MRESFLAALRRRWRSRKHLKRLTQSVRRYLAAGNIDEALNSLASFVEQMESDPTTTGQAVGSETADALCLEVGRTVMRETHPAGLPDRGNSESRDVYIASGIYAAGGHTAVIGDFVAAARDRPAWLLLTDYGNCHPEPQASTRRRTRINGHCIRLAPRGPSSSKLRWLIATLQELSPQRLFLFHHPEDAVAVAAGQPQLAGQVYLVHHVDFMPCLGAACTDFTHVDLTPARLATCGRRLAPRQPLFLPLCADDVLLPQRPPYVFPLRTATSGSIGKFALTGRFDYPGVIADLIEATGVTHFHIGPLSVEYKQQIQRSFSRPSMFESHFQHIPHVASLTRALRDVRVDVYLNSFPHRGARASVEVMCSGTPAIWHARNESWFHDTHMKYDQAAVWREPKELIRLIQTATPTWLAAQAHAARHWYEAHHHPSIITRCLADNQVQSWQPPARASSSVRTATNLAPRLA